MTTRKDQIIEQAKHEDSEGYFGFISGAEWADSHPIDPNSHIIELIHQRSIAFDDARDAREKLAIAVDYLEQISKNKWVSGSMEMIGSEHTLQAKAKEALLMIKDMK